MPTHYCVYIQYMQSTTYQIHHKIGNELLFFFYNIQYTSDVFAMFSVSLMYLLCYMCAHHSPKRPPSDTDTDECVTPRKKAGR